MDSSISRKDLPGKFRQSLLRTDQQRGQSFLPQPSCIGTYVHNILDQSPLPCHLFQPLLLGELLSKTANSDFLRKLKLKLKPLRYFNKKSNQNRNCVEIENSQNTTCVISSEKQSRDHHCTYSAHGHSPSIRGSPE